MENLQGEGKLKGRLMEFKAFLFSKEGRSIDQGYVYYLTVSDDNKRITGYYTVNGVKADRDTMHYYRVKEGFVSRIRNPFSKKRKIRAAKCRGISCAYPLGAFNAM